MTEERARASLRVETLPLDQEEDLLRTMQPQESGFFPLPDLTGTPTQIKVRMFGTTFARIEGRC